MTDEITVAILVKDKALTLPLYLECLENQSYPKDKMHIWIRSNNNNDNSIEILSDWVNKNKHFYKSIVEDYSNSDVDVTNYKNHEWNADRFQVLGTIRQQSIQYAINNNTHYFVADCDNFIKPNVLEELYKTKLPVVGPYLQLLNMMYSNYHHEVDSHGYFKSNNQYHWIHSQQIKGYEAMYGSVIYILFYVRFSKII